jgi:hypothetical protein
MAEDISTTGHEAPANRLPEPGAAVGVEGKPGPAENNAGAAGNSTPQKNGATSLPGSTTTAEGDRSNTERAEEMVDRFAERVGHWTSVVGRKLLWLGARAREEAEDIWAEAQNISQRRQP